MKTQFTTFLSAALLGLAAQTAHASVIISNLDPANTDYPQSESQQGQAVQISNRPISLTSVQFSQATGGIATGETFSVYSRTATGTLGTSLFTAFTLSYDATMGVTTAAVTTGSTFTLAANSSYFFVLTAAGTGTADWDYTTSTDYAASAGVTLPTTNDSFLRATATSSIAYFSLAAGPQEFQVNGSALPAVPEPSTYAFMGLALAGGVTMLARRRAASAV